jgi:thioredoxin reductase
LNVPGEKEFTGKGISYCATCDAPFFRDKMVAVIGGGNSALDSAILLSELAKKVYLIHRRDEFRGFESFVDELKNKKNVEFVLNSVVVEFRGDKTLKSVIIEDVNTKRGEELEVAGVFIEVGSEVKTDFIKDLVKLDEYNQIVINNNSETSHPGIFAAGDVTDTPFKQIVVAAGTGAKAGLNAYNYIHGVKSNIVVDWGKTK